MTQPQAGAVTGELSPTHAPIKNTPADVRRRLRSIFSGSIGNLVKRYDWYVYSAFALYLAKSFLLKGDQTAQLLNTATVFAVGFLACPVGGWLTGIYVDRYGRKRTLFFSMVLMCADSLIIALTSSYATIGVAAPVLLMLTRLPQGLSVGGECGTLATYLNEVTNKENRGFYSSFQYVMLIAGQLTALALLIVLQQFVLSPAQLEAWGWCIPSFVGALCALVAMAMRSHMEEMQSFTAVKANKKCGTLSELAKHPCAVATVVGLTMGGTVAFYTYSIHMQKSLANTVGLSKDTAILVPSVTLLLFAMLQPTVGGLSDRIGRRLILIMFGMLGTLFTVPIMTGISQITNVRATFFLIMAALVIVSGYTSINAVVKAELFPAEVRVLSVGLPYVLTVSIFGDTAEYIVLWPKQAGHESLFYWYVTGTIFLSLLVYVFMRDIREHSRIEH